MLFVPKVLLIQGKILSYHGSYCGNICDGYNRSAQTLLDLQSAGVPHHNHARHRETLNAAVSSFLFSFSYSCGAAAA